MEMHRRAAPLRQKRKSPSQDGLFQIGASGLQRFAAIATLADKALNGL